MSCLSSPWREPSVECGIGWSADIPRNWVPASLNAFRSSAEHLPVKSKGVIFYGSVNLMGATFLNTDLILKARFDLRPLAGALTNMGLVLLGDVTVKGGAWRATLESDLVRPTPERAAARIVTAVESLDDVQRASWRECVSRCLDFGYECCDEPFESSTTIGNPLLLRIASTGATMAVTIYRGSKRGLEPASDQQVD